MRISFKTIVLLGSFLICITQTSCKQAAAQTVIDGKFKEYKLILQEVNPMSPNSDESFKAFQSKVKSALNEGWSLVGGASDLGGYISQTVAK